MLPLETPMKRLKRQHVFLPRHACWHMPFCLGMPAGIGNTCCLFTREHVLHASLPRPGGASCLFNLLCALSACEALKEAQQVLHASFKGLGMPACIGSMWVTAHAAAAVYTSGLRATMH